MADQDLPTSTPPPHQPDAPPDVWAAHFSTARGRRLWPSEELVRSLAGRRFGTVVEAGCGDGANLGLLSASADHVVGVDACAEARALAEARKAAFSNVSIVAGDLRDLPAAAGEGRADAVVDVQASQHLRWAEHAGAYASYRRALQAGGLLVLLHFADGMTVGHAPPDELYTYAEIPPYPGVSPVCVPPTGALLRCLAESGFTVNDWREVVRITRTFTVRYAVIEAEAI